MKSFKIEINVSDAGGIYTADSIDAAKEIAEQECHIIYSQLKGRCSVSVESVEEIQEN